ncbi:anti-virulence regulator CigR family protein [Roseomonas sp. HF4]|uniref:anti-virulence regulator CigR family protein n=1 Tax=Roseomonas sp. HF4 TaxID=2562313 RepID=UPI001485A0FD|nr:anti-virulence regulator CigR family protein [Roseomonas sp. HF4]
MTRTRRFLLRTGLVLLPMAALADPPQGRGNQGRGNQGGGQGQGQGRGGGPPPGRDNAGGGGRPAFAGDARTVVGSWQAANPGWSPRPLPPGQMRQLARGRPLPPGIARQQVPPGLLSQLPAYPGHSYAMIGTSLVLLGAGGVVVDIMAGLF